jgi:DNA (cytosine-5)-methyltransferase 1
MLADIPVPYVIENVNGARWHMATTLVLHGGMFGLGVHRPRRFESNVVLFGFKARQAENPVAVYGARPDGRTTYRYRNNGNYKGKSLIRAAHSVEEAQEVMGIGWMPEWDEIKEAIPPAYTELIGAQLMEVMSKQT